MTKLFEKLKQILPRPIKAVLRPFYHRYKKLANKVIPQTYANQLNAEINRFSQEEEVNDLPDIFHYWSNKYLVPKFQAYGFSNPDEFFFKYAQMAIENCEQSKVQILSIGAGNCDTEIKLAKSLASSGHSNFIIQCMDINEAMFQRGMRLAETEGVRDHLVFLQADFNHWKAAEKYDLVIANQSLHHVVELEHLFDNIKSAMRKNGKFITSDVIGRNGHMRWPEALDELNKIWHKMPDKYKHNHAFNRHEKKYINHDCSREGFEGIRAQDVLPLLVERFEFELFIPFANLILIFVDRNFGPNFSIDDPEDLAFIDNVQKSDEALMADGTIKPTMMLAVMNSDGNVEPNNQHNILAKNTIRAY
ncbi:class I SAM-dependent methyltransferase [Marinicella sp. S1101]|uniref:class I SAM-dependent methyltransferase n=1 Tax=Marinicella marina TaxID=2996016 RepID=UPI002260AF30|nr:class I SAM-dependent methyltransferase [Marinicella marina]MCX7553268.1 class I SAM-dependent methyltransferase [Marinicella marina]MDJ1139000.1 class I SAM-dependent methyltransferase [Marinicella marina]